MFPGEEKLSRTDMEERVQKIWYQVLRYAGPILSNSTSFFSLKDDPESFIRLFHLYSINFSHNLRITSFLEQPTIAGHACLLLESATLETTCDRSHSINIREGELSFRLHFSSKHFYTQDCILDITSHLFLSLADTTNYNIKKDNIFLRYCE